MVATFMILCFVKFSSNFEKFNSIFLSKFLETRNFDKIILNFAKFEENVAKHEISQPPYVGVE